MFLDEAYQCRHEADKDLLTRFRGIYGAAYMCRYPPCFHSDHGYKSRKDRDSHETVHWKRLSCGEPSCEFYASGFRNRTALVKHVRKYHFQRDAKEIPPLGLELVNPFPTSNKQQARNGLLEDESISVSSPTLDPLSVKSPGGNAPQQSPSDLEIQEEQLHRHLRERKEYFHHEYLYLQSEAHQQTGWSSECERFLCLVNDYDKEGLNDYSPTASMLLSFKNSFWIYHESLPEATIRQRWLDSALKINKTLDVTILWFFPSQESENSSSISNWRRKVMCSKCDESQTEFLNAVKLRDHMKATHRLDAKLRECQDCYVSRKPSKEQRVDVSSPEDQIPTQGLTNTSFGLSSLSSYWPVEEQRRFRGLLRQHGSDWDSIARDLRTKTRTMVKNFYHRVLTSEPLLEEVVGYADARKSRPQHLTEPESIESNEITDHVDALRGKPSDEPWEQYMDKQPFSRILVGASIILQQLPQHIKTWGDLKQWIYGKIIDGQVSVDMFTRLKEYQLMAYRVSRDAARDTLGWDRAVDDQLVAPHLGSYG